MVPCCDSLSVTPKSAAAGIAFGGQAAERATPAGAGSGPSAVSVRVVHAGAAFERLHRVALERGGQARAEQARAGDGPIAESPPDRVRGLGRPASAATFSGGLLLEQGQLLAL